MTKDGVDGGSGTLEVIDERTAVDVRLFEEEVCLRRVVARGWEVRGSNLGLDTLGDGVIELYLGVEAVCGRPALSEGDAWTLIIY